MSDFVRYSIVTGPLIDLDLKAGPMLFCFADIKAGSSLHLQMMTLAMNCGRLNLQVSKVEEPDNTFEFEGKTVNNFRRDKLIVHLEPRTT